MTDSVTTVRAFYEALGRGDSQAAFGLFDPAITWLEAERSPYFQGEIQGMDAIVGTVFLPIGNDFEGFRATPKEFLGDKDRVAALGQYTGLVRSSGANLQADFVHVWTVRNGKLTRFEQYTDTAAWAEAFA